MTGIVSYYCETKGYGFIETEDITVFVKKSALIDVDVLEVGQDVSFETITTSKGVESTEVRVIG